jgi:hypothetical protein
MNRYDSRHQSFLSQLPLPPFVTNGRLTPPPEHMTIPTFLPSSETSVSEGITRTIPRKNKFWEELICLLSLHKHTVDNIQCHHLHTKFHPNPPIGSKVAPTSEV